MKFLRRREPTEEEVLTDLRNLVRQFGWAVHDVEPERGSQEVACSYTVGLTAMGHPEIVVQGLPAHAAHDYLYLAVEAVRLGGRFTHGQRTTELTGVEAPVFFIDALDTSRLTAVAQIHGTVRALQLVWPDSSGHLPWEEGYRNPREVQPLLGPVPAE